MFQSSSAKGEEAPRAASSSGASTSGASSREINAALETTGSGNTATNEYSFSSLTYTMQRMEPGQYFDLQYLANVWKVYERGFEFYMVLWGAFARDFVFQARNDGTSIKCRFYCIKHPPAILEISQDPRIRDSMKFTSSDDLEKALKGISEKTVKVKITDISLMVAKFKKSKHLKQFSATFLQTPNSLYIQLKKAASTKEWKENLQKARFDFVNGCTEGKRIEIMSIAQFQTEALSFVCICGSSCSQILNSFLVLNIPQPTHMTSKFLRSRSKIPLFI